MVQDQLRNDKSEKGNPETDLGTRARLELKDPAERRKDSDRRVDGPVGIVRCRGVVDRAQAVEDQNTNGRRRDKIDRDETGERLHLLDGGVRPQSIFPGSGESKSRRLQSVGSHRRICKPRLFGSTGTLGVIENTAHLSQNDVVADLAQIFSKARRQKFGPLIQSFEKKRSFQDELQAKFALEIIFNQSATRVCQMTQQTNRCNMIF